MPKNIEDSKPSHIESMFPEHFKQAEKIRKYGAVLFFNSLETDQESTSDTKEYGMFFEEKPSDFREDDFADLYSSIDNFFDNHIIILNNFLLSSQDVSQLNNLLNMMNNIIRSFPEVRVYGSKNIKIPTKQINHFEQAEKIRQYASALFFHYSDYEQEHFSNKETDYQDLYQSIKGFVKSHNSLMELITINRIPLSDIKLKELNKFPNMMNAIIKSFPEVGVYGATLIELSSNSTDTPISDTNSEPTPAP
jgi:hypothetical protein